MQAIVLTKYGLPAELQRQEVPKPRPEAGEVLVRVHAAAVNDWDWVLVRGQPYYIRLLCGLTKPNISIPGAEVAGRVEVVGAGVTQLREGDAVYGDLSECGFGAFAEYVSVPEQALAHKPESLSFAEAAALPHAALLALQGLRDEGQLQPGQTLLINGAGGGVGTLGIQMAKAFGVAEVTGVDTGDKLDLLRSLGYDHVVDYQAQDFTATGRRYDLILDTKTNRSAFKYLRALKPGGRYVTVGGGIDRILQGVLLAPLLRAFSNKDFRLVALKTNRDLAYLNELVETGTLRPAIEGPYTLREVPDLIQRLGEGRHAGKIVVAIAHDALT